MTIFDPSDPLAFFKAMHHVFGAGLAPASARDPIAGLLNSAFENFERAVAPPPGDAVDVACRGGCASCCTIQVAATAPEILLIARAIRASPIKASLALRRKTADLDRATRRLSAQQRMRAGLACAFVEEDLCVIYAVRPLACRGHASFDKQACVDALAGRACDVPISALHVTARSLVQNALQSALRDAGLGWALYELNQSLQIALSNEACEASWIEGEDIFAPAMIADVSLAEMAETFDAIKATI
jgi:Fe-S-cluster containining protein